MEEAKEATKEAAGGISVDNKESTAGPSTEPSKQARVKKQRRKKTDPVPDPVATTLNRIEKNPPKRTDRACDNCRIQKLKCDNQPNGCAQCLKKDVHLLRRDVQQLQLENMQLRNALAGLQASFPNRNQFPWNPPPARQVHAQAPYDVHAQAQAAGQGAGRMPLPANLPPVGQGTLYFTFPPDPPQAGQGPGQMPLPANLPPTQQRTFPPDPFLVGQGAGQMQLPASIPPPGQEVGNLAPPPDVRLAGPGPLNFPPGPNLPPVIQEPANFIPAPRTPSPEQGSSSDQSSGGNPYRTSSELSLIRFFPQ